MFDKFLVSVRTRTMLMKELPACLNHMLHQGLGVAISLFPFFLATVFTEKNHLAEAEIAVFV